MELSGIMKSLLYMELAISAPFSPLSPCFAAIVDRRLNKMPTSVQAVVKVFSFCSMQK